jgi:hypothetical protein
MEQEILATPNPTAVIACAIKQENAPTNQVLVRFFDSNPEFNFRTAGIDAYLAGNPEALSQIADNEKPILIRQLHRLQRLFWLTDDAPVQYAAMRRLIDDGLDSAQAIASMGVESFCSRYPENPGEVGNPRAVHAKAAHRAAMAMALFAKHSPQYNAVEVAAIGPSGAVAAQAAGEATSNGRKSPAVLRGNGGGGPSIPDWEKLFGALNRCQCEHCRSVLSPSAFLVDLLHQLKELQLTGPGNKTALDVLRERRPDIVEIPLTCANVDTTLPYVDLVNEVLEAAIHPELVGTLEFEITENRDQFEKELNSGEVSDTLCRKFPAEYPITKKARVTFKKTTESGATSDWVIEFQGYGYNVHSSLTGEFIVSVSRPWRTVGTTASTNELGAYPEHLDVQVYDKLKEQIFPWAVPFDLWAEEVRVYLEHLGTPRYRLMELLRTDTKGETDAAAEHFGLTAKEQELIGILAPDALQKAWGASDGESWTQGLTSVPVLLGRAGLSYDQLTELLATRYVDPSKGSRISFPEFKTEDDHVTRSACDYTQASIEWPTNDAKGSLQRIHRFLRLQRKTGWSIGEFDKVLTALGYAACRPEECRSFDAGLLVALRRVHELQAGFDLSLDEVLSWFTDIDTDRRSLDEAALYDRLFQDRAIQGAEAAFALNEDRTELQNAGSAKLEPSNHSVIRAALRINQTDLDELLKRLWPDGSDEKAPALNLKNLSRLYRSASLARALRLTVRDFLTLAELTDFRLEEQDEPNDRVRCVANFVTEARLMERSGFGIAELDYLLRHGDSAVAPDDRLIGRLLEDIQSSLKAIDDDISSTARDADQVKTILLRLDWDEGTVDRTIDLLRQSEPLKQADRDLLTRYLRMFEVPTYEVELDALPASIEFPVEFGESLSYDADAKRLRLRGWLSKADKDVLLGLAADDNAYQDAIEALSSGIAAFEPRSKAAHFLDDAMTVEKLIAKSVEARWQAILERLIPYARPALSEQLVKQKLGEALGLEARTIHKLLTLHLKAAGGQKAAIDAFLAPAFIKNPGSMALTRKGFPDQFATFDLLNKAAMLVGRLRIEPDQLDWLFGDERFDGININQLPPVRGEKPDNDLYKRFAALVELCAVRDRVGAEAAAHLLDLATSDSPESRKELADRTGWSAHDIDTLIEKWDLAKETKEPENPKLSSWTATTLARFCDSLKAIRGLGCNAETAMKWCEPELSNETVQEIRQAVKANYGEKRWLEVARPLRDILREKQRAVLVDYLLVQQKAAGANALYEKYLLDVEMSPCMLTSRTKLALSSVQLFVQRLLMNLEEYRIPQGQAAFCKKQWQWLKNYRVWEANRKIFLYPENWIEPELRKDKTPFFKELETELLQAEMTDETAERAFRNYLQQLAEVAKLVVCGMFHERERNDSGEMTVDVLHVFGRTGSVPRTHYYRRRAKNVWSPWEKVTTGISGDHLIPVVFNRRLYLFWPEITEQITNVLDKDNNPQKTEKEDGSVGGVQQTWKFWEIRLAYCEYRQGMWSGKQTAEAVLRVDHPPKPAEMKSNQERHERQPKEALDFTFMTELEAQALTIRCAQWTQQKNQSTYEWNWCGGFLITNDERARVLKKEELSKFAEILKPPFPDDTYEGMSIRLRDGEALKINGKELFGRCGPGARIQMSHEFASSGSSNGGPGDFFYQDDDRVIYVSTTSNPAKKYRLTNFYHPDLTGFLRRLNREGLSGLLQRGPQASTSETLLFQLPDFERTHFLKKQPSLNDQKRIVQLFFEQPRKRTLEERGLHMKGPDIKFLPSPPEPAFQSETREREVSLSMASFPVTATTDVLPSPASAAPVNSLIEFSEGDKKWQCLACSDAGAISILQDFEQEYLPNADQIEGYDPASKTADKGLPAAVVDFRPDGAYSQYNWELFFHAPLLLANALSKNQRFEEAQRWFHHIFDPTDISGHDGPKRYWKTLPFFAESGSKVVDLIALLHYRGDTPDLKQKKQDLETQVGLWRDAPFEPHVIAGWRLDAYQKTVVMKYLDNLIAWADQLFRQDSIESINEATQLYILAAEILGKRPLSIAPQRQPKTHSFERLDSILDKFSDALVALETAAGETKSVETVTADEQPADPSLKKMPYFCVPDNDKLLSYWNTMADRLFKIRHCQNIEGVERALRLFEPPIEPGLLVRAAAAGIDISSALKDTNAPLPHHRFSVMLKKALAFCNDVKALGSAYLSALEKKDAEGLAELQRRQSGPDVRTIKEQQIEDAKKAVSILNHTLTATESKIKYLREKEGTLAAYKLVMGGLGTLEKSFKIAAQVGAVSAAGLAPVPGLEYNAQGLASGSTLKQPITAEVAKYLSEVQKENAEITALTAEVVKWVKETGVTISDVVHNLDLADKDKDKTNLQIEIAKARISILEQELKNLDIQAKNAAEVEDYLRRKFTNQELYNWRVSQLSALYFQSYQMAYDLAKRAERAFRYEPGDDDTSFIRFGYWDSLKKGLLAGEQLYFDLKRMEKAYLERDRRGFEITRHVPLQAEKLLDLAKLKEDGVCFVDLPESLFDGDYPGHYRRRIKTVSLTIDSDPAPGTYANVNCTLTLLKNTVRMKSSVDGGYERGKDDPRFREELGAVQSIVTSSGRNDSGLFQVNFHDDRYLPFEGTGAISSWKIELPKERNRDPVPGMPKPDLGTLKDVVLHIKYTALDGGEALKEAAEKAAKKTSAAT